MGLILEYMATSGKTISELQEGIPHYHMIKEKIQGTQERAYRIIRQLRKKYSDKGEISLLDGLKIAFKDYWVHIRPSNTEPIIRLIIEAKSRDTAKKMSRLWRAEISEIVKWK
jgi:phosphomannomutase